MEENILTADQVAQKLQVHPFTVLKFIKQGKLKASKLGRVYRIRETDVTRFLDEQQTAEVETPAKSSSGRKPKASKSSVTGSQKDISQDSLPLVSEPQEVAFIQPETERVLSSNVETETNLTQAIRVEEIVKNFPTTTKQSVSTETSSPPPANNNDALEFDHYILD